MLSFDVVKIFNNNIDKWMPAQPVRVDFVP